MPPLKSALSSPPLPPEDLAHVLLHTRELWEELRGGSLFITGGTGFFGMWLLESFVYANETLGLGARATVLTRDPLAFAAKAPHLCRRPDLSFIAGDLRTFTFPSGKFPFIIHGGTSSERVESLELFETILEGTRRVLQFATYHGTRKLLFVSSGAVYGCQPPELVQIPETYMGAPDPFDPDSAYGEGKRASELLCTLHARKNGFEAKIARCFAFVGPHLPLDTHFAVGNFVRDALAGSTIYLSGDGTPSRSYLYSADLAVWLWTVLLRGQAFRAYNVGSSHDVSIAALAETVRNSVGVSTSICVSRSVSEANTRLRYVPDTRRASMELGLKEEIDLDEAIRRTARWYSISNPNVTNEGR